MNLRASVKRRLTAILGESVYLRDTPGDAPALDSEPVERMRRQVAGGQLVPLPQTRTRWFMSDLEIAQHQADTGDLSMAAQLMRSARTDGKFAGVLSTRCDGLVQLPRSFRGDPEIVASLEQRADPENDNATPRSTFDDLCPPSELAMLAADALLLGVFVAELLPVKGRDFPVLTRLDPEYLIYRWSDNRWYYRSTAGLLRIDPGDGRWVFFAATRTAPWNAGCWKAIGNSFIRKEHAKAHSDNWEGKLANPARIAVAPQGSTEEQKQAWFRKVMAWGVNTVFGMIPGYDVKLLESNGRGFEAFGDTQDRCDREYIVCIAGQEVTTDGGAGFQNSDIHRTIRTDLIKSSAASLAHVLNTQVIPVYTLKRWGEEALDRSPCVEYDATPPKDRNAEASAATAVGAAIKSLDEALEPHGLELDAGELCKRFQIPIKNDRNGDGVPDGKAPANDTKAPAKDEPQDPDEDPEPEREPEPEKVAAALVRLFRSEAFIAASQTIRAAEFNEKDHPRAKDGKFGKGGGGGGSGSQEKSEKEKSAARERAQKHFDAQAAKARAVAEKGGHAETMHRFLNVDRHAVSRAERDGADHELSDKTTAFLKEAKAAGADYKGPVYRGTTPAELEQILSGGANRTTWSVSKDAEGSAHFAKKGGVLLVIERNSGAIPVDGLENSNTFNEALIPKGSKWRIAAEETRDGMRVVKLEATK